MVTCERCSNVSGAGTKGDSWICDDCRIKPDLDIQGEGAAAPGVTEKRTGEAKN